MRTVKFRAKAIINDKHSNIKVDDFVFGCYIESGCDAPCIIFGDGEQIEIDKKTLGQLVGIKDLNGVDIYETDTVSQRYYPLGSGKQEIYSKVGVVVFQKGSFAISWKIKTYTHPTDSSKSKSEAWSHPTSKSWVDTSFTGISVVDSSTIPPNLITSK